MSFEFLNSPISLGYYYLVGIYYLFIFALVIKIILEQKDPAKTIGYLLLLLFIPIVGLVIYHLFGINLRKQKLFNRKALTEQEKILSFFNDSLKKSTESFHELEGSIKHGKKLAQLLIANDKAPLFKNNSIKIFENGEEIFPVMLEAIDNAKEYIHLEFYKIALDNTGNIFLDALKEKASQGLEIKIIYDDVGSIDISKKVRSELQQFGIEIYPFMPVRFPRFTSRINYRDHRKILIVDGKVCFMGGINLRDAYDNSIPQPLYWKDLGYQLKGEAISSAQFLFFLNWLFVSGEKLEFSPKYFKKISDDNVCPIQIAASSPDSDWPSIMQAIFELINSAKHTLKLCTPYFVPNSSIVTALKTAALSGVDVQLLIPTNPDSKIAKAVSISFLGELLNAGVKIYMYTKGMMHAKFVTVDNTICTMGSSNLDIRSFEYNFEINAIIYNKDISTKLDVIFEADKKECFLLTKEQWENRPIHKKLAQGIMRMVAPLM